jgi:hypothetical protein
MIRTMSSTRLYLVGRVTAGLTIMLVIAAVITFAVAVSKVHPPRAIQTHGPKNS